MLMTSLSVRRSLEAGRPSWCCLLGVDGPICVETNERQEKDQRSVWKGALIRPAHWVVNQRTQADYAVGKPKRPHKPDKNK